MWRRFPPSFPSIPTQGTSILLFTSWLPETTTAGDDITRRLLGRHSDPHGITFGSQNRSEMVARTRSLVQPRKYAHTLAPVGV